MGTTVAQCTICRAANPPHARFCCTCGQPVYRAPSPPRGGMGVGLAIVVLMAGVFASVCVGFGAMHYARRDRGIRTTVPQVQRSFVLPPAKADALYELLRPSSVRVIVGRDDDGVYIRGTIDEVESIDVLVDLLTRERCAHQRDCGERMDELRPTFDTTRRHKLTGATARALATLLAFEDVPVLVSRQSSKVTVEASRDDQATVRRVVDILRGNRPRMD